MTLDAPKPVKPTVTPEPQPQLGVAVHAPGVSVMIACPICGNDVIVDLARLTPDGNLHVQALAKAAAHSDTCAAERAKVSP